jgi:CxxC motif-containing protein (DUF1111 family)
VECHLIMSNIIKWLAVIMLLLQMVNISYAAEIHSGGKTSSTKQGQNAFSLPASNLPMTKRLDFSVGNSFFRNPWVPAPSSTDARDGLGPLFNTNGCQNCHIKDGRGHPPKEGEVNAVSMLVRMSIPALTQAQQLMVKTMGVVPEPTYGDQLQDFALPSQQPEGKINVYYQPVVAQFADGYEVELRKPTVVITELAYGPLHPDTMFSARVAPPMIGLGLLEAIPQKAILAGADEQDRDGDGISGRPNYVWNVQIQHASLGRFGWKAGQPSLMQQNAAAFNGDLGVTSSLFPQSNCGGGQPFCDDLPNGGEPEVSDNILHFVEFYSQHLAVPVRRDVENPVVKVGQKIFQQVGCAACHKESMTTGDVLDRPELSQQTIHPYTDLLLHDMGDGLADHRPEALASGFEWRTPPLWGLGYTQEVSGHTQFLHDGRARNALEAVLWHGGEAEPAQRAVLQLSASEREALVAFLNSL